MYIPRIPLLLLTAFVCCQYTEAATFDNYPTRRYRLGTKRTINDIKEERLKQRQMQKEAELRAAEEAQRQAEREAEREAREAQWKAEREAREAQWKAEREAREAQRQAEREAEQKRLQEDRERWEAAERERKADDNSYAQAKMRAREIKARYDIPENDQSFDIRRETYLFTEKRYAEAYNKLAPNNKKAHEIFLRKMEKGGNVKRIPTGSSCMISWVYQDGVEPPSIYRSIDHEDFEIYNEKELDRYQKELDSSVLNIVCEVEFIDAEEKGYISWAETSNQGPRYNAAEKDKAGATGKAAYPRKKDKQ